MRKAFNRSTQEVEGLQGRRKPRVEVKPYPNTKEQNKQKLGFLSTCGLASIVLQSANADCWGRKHNGLAQH